VLDYSLYVTLEQLGRAFQTLKTSNVAFILDTSFGDTKRGQGSRAGKSKGGRSAIGSAPMLETKKRSLHLRGLRQNNRWRVLCAVPHNGVTGEYKGQGILTGLMLDKLTKAKSEMGLNALYESIERRYMQRIRSQFGVPYPIDFGAVGLGREFLLVTKNRKRRSTKRVEKGKTGESAQ
jgi:hypothetical protein